jgi:probable HAF family extracellular repeat protein
MTSFLPLVHAQQRYTVTDLGALGGTWAAAYGINASGEVTGQAQTATGEKHAFLYKDGVMTDLGTLPQETQSVGASINASGEIVGYARDYNVGNQWQAFISDGSTITKLTAAAPQSWAYAINNAGVIAGAYTTLVDYSELSQGFIYDGSTIKQLGMSGYSYGDTVARGINDSGEAVGWTLGVIPGQFGDHAFLYDGTSIKLLGDLGTGASKAYAINDAGQVTGYSTDSMDGSAEAFFYAGTTMTGLGFLDQTYRFSRGYAINSAGDVVGTSSSTKYMNEDAFIYENGVMEDLNDLVPADSGIHLSEAWGINDAGQIIANNIDRAGNETAYLLTPIPAPEPTGGSLLTLAAAAALLYRPVTRGRWDRSQALADGPARPA